LESSPQKGQRRDSARIYNSPAQRFERLLQTFKAKYRSRDRHVIACLGTLIPENGVIFDIGSHHGNYAKEFARLHQGEVQVHCFEPSPYNAAILEAVVGKLSNVTINRFALADHAEEADLYLPIKETGRLGTGIGHFGEEKTRDYITERVRTTTLDAYAKERGLSRFDFLKCDVEGAEMQVLNGGSETIRRFRPTIYIEIAEEYLSRMGHCAKDVFELLGSFGYDAYQMELGTGALRPVDDHQGPENYIFRAKNSRQ